MKKRFIATILCAVMAVFTALAFVGCGGNDGGEYHPKDTFYKGTVSESSYETTNAAAEAFISEQISGDVTDATFVAYDKKSDLTEEEIAELVIPETEKEKIASVEKGEIKYTIAAESGVLASAEENVKLYVIIIIRYNDNTYKYYAPVLNTGDPITKAYYDEVFANEKYENCTMKGVVGADITAKQSGITMTANMKITTEGKINDEYMYVKVTTSLNMLGMSNKSVVENFVVWDENMNATKEFTRIDGGEWSSLGNYYDAARSSVADNKLSAMPAFDYSYFQKTSTGFKLNSEKFAAFLQGVMDEVMGDMSDMISSGVKINITKATYDCFVEDGKVSQTVMTVAGNYTVDGVNCTLNEKVTLKYSDFGTTTVTIPSDLVL